MQEEPSSARKHSGFGMASFVIAMVQGLMTIFVVGVACAVVIKSPESENEVGFLFVGLVVLGGVLVNLVGLALAVVGLLQEDRRREFSFLGLIFNGIGVLLVVSFIVLGVILDQGP